MPRNVARLGLLTRQGAVLEEFVSVDSLAGAEEPIANGNDIASLRGGDMAYSEMLSAIAAACDSILMSTDIIRQ